MAYNGAEPPAPPDSLGDGFLDEVAEGAEVTADTVFVIMGMLLVGIITRHIFSRFPLPYTVLLLVSSSPFPLSCTHIPCRLMILFH
jgi:hypothetical protein